MGDFVNKKICLNISLSVILGLLFVTPLVIQNLSVTDNIPKTVNALNSNCSKVSENDINNQKDASSLITTSKNQIALSNVKVSPAPAPTFKITASATEVLPSTVNSSNYTNYFYIDYPYQIKNFTGFTSNNVTGELDMDINIYTTTDLGHNAPYKNVPYNITGFAKTGISEPKFEITDKVLSERTLPSTINNNNYKDYLNVVDPDISLITNDITFDSDNSTGKLTIDGYYYTTNYHATNAPKHTLEYQFEGFAFYSKKPSFKINNIPNEVSPSTINITNYRQYLEVKDDNTSLVPDSIRFNSDDSTGLLTVSGSYYSTNFHGSGAFTSNYSYDIKGFSVNKNKTSTINEDIIIIATVSSVFIILIVGLIAWYFSNKSKDDEMEITLERDTYPRRPHRMQLDYSDSRSDND